MHRIITNSDTLTTRLATAEEVACAAARSARTAQVRAACVARYAAARSRVLAAAPHPRFWLAPVSTNADFERLVRQAWATDHPQRAAHGGEPAHARTWADYAEKVAERYAPKLPYYAHQGSDPSTRS